MAEGEIQRVRALLGDGAPVYVAVFAHTHEDFHLPIFCAVMAHFDVDIEILEPYMSPLLFVRVRAPLSLAGLTTLANFLSDISLIKAHGLLLGIGGALGGALLPGASDRVLASVLGLAEWQTFRFSMAAVGCTYAEPAKIEAYGRLYDQLPSLAAAGLSCDLRRPQLSFTAIDDRMGTIQGAGFGTRAALTVALPRSPAQRLTHDCIHRFLLPSRRYLGPTSMDAQLAFMMCELARVRPGDWVCDPFCGTCGILVAAAFYGAVAYGSDLNIRILRGKATTYVDNFAQYGLPFPDVALADAGRCAFRGRVFDSIICDPPYAIRAGCRVSSASGSDPHKAFGIAATESRDVADIYLCALDFSVQSLAVGGRLVFWLPCLVREFSAANDVPAHPDFRLVCCPLQQFTGCYGRRLCVLERHSADHLDTPACYAAEAPSHAHIAAKLGRAPPPSSVRPPTQAPPAAPPAAAAATTTVAAAPAVRKAAHA